MPIRISNIHLPLDHPDDAPEAAAVRWLGVAAGQIRSARVRRRSVDARRGRRLGVVYVVDVEVQGDEQAALAGAGRRSRDRKIRAAVIPAGRPAPPTPGREPLSGPVVVVGAGPAGIFAAARLAERGFRPVLIERGKPTEARMKDLRRFRLFGRLNPESNLLFGEGGAGMYSDGKLTTRNRSPLTDEVLDMFHAAGAPASILVEARPHIGSNFLPKIIRRLRSQLTRMGVTYRFDTRLSGLEIGADGTLEALRVIDASGAPREERVEPGAVLLATGGSAREIFAVLEAAGVALEARPTLMGVRVEHPQELIDRNQFGEASGSERLGRAEYFLTLKARPAAGLPRPVHSFCMCPGGEVIAIASEAGGLSANGMSVYSRSSGFANSAMIAPVQVDDYGGEGPLAGVAFQRRLERAVYEAGGSDYSLPAQALADFHEGRSSSALPPGPRVTRRRLADVHSLLPGCIAPAIRGSLRAADGHLPGFLTNGATVYGLEVRTSSPVRILRGPTGESRSTRNLYPAGEGAGYAGGIMSAAIDGMEQADRIIRRFAPPA